VSSAVLDQNYIYVKKKIGREISVVLQNFLTSSIIVGKNQCSGRCHKMSSRTYKGMSSASKSSRYGRRYTNYLR
jgi:hypothetical protein